MTIPSSQFPPNSGRRLWQSMLWATDWALRARIGMVLSTRNLLNQTMTEAQHYFSYE